MTARVRASFRGRIEAERVFAVDQVVAMTDRVRERIFDWSQSEGCCSAAEISGEDTLVSAGRGGRAGDALACLSSWVVASGLSPKRELSNCTLMERAAVSSTCTRSTSSECFSG